MIITTPNLVLRPLDSGDVAELWPFVSDPEISRHMSWNAHVSVGETEAFVEDVRNRMAAGSTIAWVIIERKSGKVCGLVSLLAIVRTHRALRYDKAELAYWVGRAYQRRGYASEACTAILNYAFSEMKLNKVTVAHDAENAASQALIARLGFRKVGTEYKHFLKDGRWIDHVIYELLASDFVHE